LPPAETLVPPLPAGSVSTKGRGVAAEKCSLLVVDDEPYILPTLTALLADEFDVITAESADAAEEILSRRAVDIVLTDQRMPKRTGIQLLEWVREHNPATLRLLMTGYGELDDAVDAINRGHVYYYLLKPWRTEDLQQVLRNAVDKVRLERNRDELMRQLSQLNADLERRVTERTRELRDANTLLEQRTRELERLILIDPLTGLFNRRAVEGLAVAEIRRHNRYGNPLALGIIDVDYFKRINTEFDLPGGDEALKALSRILTTSLRDVDSVGRIGGEEFLIIARETNADGATALAERIRSTVATTPIDYRRRQISITVSLGFAAAEDGVQSDFAAMYQLAAGALSCAKRDGRNCFVIRRIGDTPADAGAEVPAAAVPEDTTATPASPGSA
jgi:diguanylate cyclase (GGDEF)-like protein